MKFDIVYTWVNGADAEYIDIWNSYSKVKKDKNPERYRDNLNLLKYSLRSLEQYFPNFGKIYLLTARPQVPEWLDQSNDRIILVHHDEIIDAEYLPTFNSNVIESYLHKIPGISDHFLYMCDDHLFGAPTSLDRFYKEDKHIVYNTFFGENLKWRIYDGYKDVIGLGLIEHNPLFINKKYWEEAFDLFSDQTHQTRSSKFRNDRNFFPLKLYRYFMLKYKQLESEHVPIHKMLKYHKFYKLTNNLSKQKRIINDLVSKPPEFYCLNDDMSGEPNQEVFKLYRAYLDDAYPSPSSFEKKS